MINKKIQSDQKESQGFFTTKRIMRSATIAAMYCVLTFYSAFFGMAYGPIQFRLGEALSILPLFFPESIVGLVVGCFISNLFSSGNLILDLTLGTSATLVSATLSYIIGRLIKKDIRVVFAILPPILINAFVVPFTFLLISELKEFYWISVFEVGIGQTAVLVLLGIPLYFLIKKLSKISPVFR